MAGLHIGSNFYVERLADGSVLVRLNDGNTTLEQILDAEAWVSAVTAVSVNPNTVGAYTWAMAFHDAATAQG